MGDGGGETPQRGHALFGGHLLLQPAQVRKVLKVEDKPAAFLCSQAQRRHADSQIAHLSMWCPKMDLLSQRQSLNIRILPGEPEILVQLLKFFPAHIREPMSQNLLAGAIEEQNNSCKVRGDQAATHGMDNVLREILEAQKFFAFFLEFLPLAPKRVDKQAGQIGNCQETQEIHNQPACPLASEQGAGTRGK